MSTPTTNMLVSDPAPDGEYGYEVLCDEHLASALRCAPLGLGEYVLTGCTTECDECGRCK